jgi:hypothetical protein
MRMDFYATWWFSDFYLESPTTNDWLEKLFLRHFCPQDTPCAGEYPEEDCPIEAGSFRITFEPL